MNNKAIKMIEILLVEDHELTRIGLKTALQQFPGLHVCGETASGKEAIGLAGTLMPDVILMDIGLHELDGIEATKIIKQNSPSVKVVMLSSHDAEQEILASFASGADGYALKESQPSQIYTAIDTVMQGDVWLSNQIAEKVLRNLYGVKVNADQRHNVEVKDKSMVPLSEREFEVLQLIVDGKSNQEIANHLYLSLATVKSHVKSILNKFCVEDRTQAAVKAIRQKMLS